MFNHVSYMDPIALVAIFPPSGLANTAVANIPFVGAVVRVCGPPAAVEREIQNHLFRVRQSEGD